MLNWDINKQIAGENSVQVAGNHNKVDRSTTNVVINQETHVSNYSYNFYKDQDEIICLNDFFSGKQRYCSEFDFVASDLTNGTFWPDYKREREIYDILNQYGVCIIDGGMGRGKTILSVSVAYRRFFRKGYNVFIIRKPRNIGKVLSLIEPLVNSDSKSLIILEDIHTVSYGLSELLTKIELIHRVSRDEGESYNPLFLINRRPSIDKKQYNKTQPRWASYCLDLDSHQISRSKAIANYWSLKYGLDYRSLSINGSLLMVNPRPNLRDLSWYFKVFRQPGNTTCSATDEEVMGAFIFNYCIFDANKLERKCLYLMCSLGYFDAPVDSTFLTNEECATFVDFRNRGICYQVNTKFYLNHSTEAETICKALSYELLCGRSMEDVFISDVTSNIIEYSNRILSTEVIPKEVRKDLEADFGTHVLSSLRYMPSFQRLRTHFYQVPIAKSVVHKISTNYLLRAIVLDDPAQKEERLSIYKENVPWIRESLLDINYVFLIILYKHLKRDYQYFDLPNDVFGDYDTSVLKEYFTKCAFCIIKDKSKLRNEISNISTTHKHLVEELPNAVVDDYGNSLLTPVVFNARLETSQIVDALREGSMSFDEARQPCEELVKAVKMRLISAPCLDSSQDLSIFLHNVSIIDYDLHERLVRDEAFLNSVNQRLGNPKKRVDDFYLFDICYSRDYRFKVQCEQMIKNSTIEFQQTMGRWLVRVHNSDSEYSKNSLAFAIAEYLRNN